MENGRSTSSLFWLSLSYLIFVSLVLKWSVKSLNCHFLKVWEGTAILPSLLGLPYLLSLLNPNLKPFYIHKPLNPPDELALL